MLPHLGNQFAEELALERLDHHVAAGFQDRAGKRQCILAEPDCTGLVVALLAGEFRRGVGDHDADDAAGLLADTLLNERVGEVPDDGGDAFHGRDRIEIHADNPAVGQVAKHLQPAPRRRPEVDDVVVGSDDAVSLLDLQQFVGCTCPVSRFHRLSIDAVFSPLRTHWELPST